MEQAIFIPKLGMTMKEGKIAQWKAGEGDWVKKGQIVLIIETQKVSYEIEADVSGFLIILAQVGDVLTCGEKAGLLVETREEFETLRKERHGHVVAGSEKAEPEVPMSQAGYSQEARRIAVSPVARKMAIEHGIDLATVDGSGPGGRIVRVDIEKAIKEKRVAPVAASEPRAEATGALDTYEGKTIKATVPLQGMRQAIAEHMHRSLAISAQLTNFSEADMTEMVRLRNEFVEQEKTIGVRVSYTDLFILILVMALKENPVLNSSLIGNEIKIWEEIHVGVAVALELGEYESGLIVPVVKNAHRKSLVVISRELKGLTEKARSRKLMPDDVEGGTFTLTNAGVFGRGGEISTPIINQPQAAILQTGAILEKAVVRNGQIVIRPMMPVCLTYDHRIIDGAPASKFLGRVVQLMERPMVVLAG